MCLAAKVLAVIAAAVVTGVTLLPIGAAQAASGEEVIKARITFMQEDIGGHWKPLAAFAKGGVGTLADVEKNAMAIVALSKKIPSHFPKDTGRGKYPDKLTRALPAIWEKPEEFSKAAQGLAEGSEKLAQLAKEGKTDEVVDMIGKSGSFNRTRIGCADCHKNFQGERVK
jgi:cytochrome c556